MRADDRWPRIRELFERAIEEQPTDPAAWLAREAPRDAPIHDDVLALLRSHAEAGAFLAQPPDAVLTDLLDEGGRLDPGRPLGPYTVEREIGRGGMGRVYLARDTRLGRRVALKALSPELTRDPAHRDRLRREARAAAALSHPGICTVYALEELDGELFIATEFVDGRTLREEIRGGRPLSPPAVVQAARELAAALGHAHAHGVVHRDLKPENVMRAVDGRLKILDFGLARLDVPGTPATHHTATGHLFGTPAYMAPEQLRGEPVDARADVFALGVLLYELACGAHPFGADTPIATAGRILQGEAVPLAARCPGLPASFRLAVERCLREAPSERFDSAGALLHALERDGSPREPRPIAAWWRTHHAVLLLLYFVASALAWQIKEWQPGPATAVFVAVAVASTIAGVFRGHLLFTEQVNAPGLAAELRRAARVTRVADLFIGTALGLSGLLLASVRPLAGALTVALAVGIALARLVVEPSTSAAFLRAGR